MRNGALILAAAVGAAFYWWRSAQEGQADGFGFEDVAANGVTALTDAAGGFLNVGFNGVDNMTATAALGKQLEPMIRAAAARYGVPADMFFRQAKQESANFSPDVVYGRRKSFAGAIGLFQFMPATAAEFRIDPASPEQSADAAGRYMAQLYRMFGDWRAAAAAYNWGPGNYRKFLAGRRTMPRETRLYAMIVHDGLTIAQAKQADERNVA